jgi:predicted nucleotidyltransferase
MRLLNKNKAQLLRLFFANPDRCFYMHEIGRALGKKPGVFQKAINAMTDEGILHSEYRANARYFSINKSYPLHNEMRSIVEKMYGVEESIKKILDKFPRIETAFIYGSFAKGEQHILSDIDMLIIGKPDDEKLLSEIEKLESMVQREINYKVYSEMELIRNIKSKSSFLLEILRDKKTLVKGSEDDLRKILKG